MGALVEISITPVVATPTTAAPEQAYTATCIYEGGVSLDCTTLVTWSSSVETVATISNGAGTEGIATAVDSGDTEITAELNRITSNVGYLNADWDFGCETITAFTTLAHIGLGATTTFTASCLMSGGTTMTPFPVTWASSDRRVATIDATGLATGISAGATDITATLSVGGVPLVSPPATLTVTP